MKYINLGSTGVKVSELCLGCMTFGVPERGEHPWTLPEEQSRPLIRQAVEAGINFFDTANTYSDGTLRGNRRPRLEGFLAPRRSGDRHQSLLPRTQGPERPRT